MAVQLKKQYPGSHLTWVVTRSIAPICRSVAEIDEVIEIEDALLKGSLPLRFKALITVWFKLFGRSFDRVIIAHADPRYRLLTLTVKAPVKRFFSRDQKARTSPISGRYRGDEYLRLLDDLEGPIPLQNEVFPEIRNSAKSLGDSKTILLVPGGAKNLLSDDHVRRWPVDYYRTLAEKLITAGLKVALIGGPQDSWTKEAFQGLPVSDLIGKTDLMSLLQTIKTARLVVSHDTGPLHMARLVGTKVIGLFGPINPREICGSSPHVLALWKGESLACAPCYDGKRYAKCQDVKCMKSLSVNEVFDAVLRSLDSFRAQGYSVGARENSDMIPEVGPQNILA